MLSSLTSFLSARRRGLTYAAATVGGAYVAGRWAVQRVLEGAERGRREGWGKEDLARRFDLNLQDSQFTVLALVPTLAAQLADEIDVEERSRMLGELARREREEKARVVERETREREEAEALRAKAAAAEAGEDRQEPHSDPVGDASPTPTEATESTPTPSSSAPFGEPLHSPLFPMPNGAPSLNPAAPAFEPRAPSPPGATLPERAEVVEASAVSLPQQDGHDAMGTSWAEVVNRGARAGGEQKEDARTDAVVANGHVSEDATAEENGYEVEGAAAASGAANDGTLEANGIAETTSKEAREEAHEATQEPEKEDEEKPVVPGKTKAELWSEIKLLSFTRLFTSIYVLVLLSLQTHVQLALLGRSSYVSSLLQSLPPRSPSPSSTRLPADPAPHPSSHPPALDDSQTQDDDLESALYAAKVLPPTPEEERKDLERKYLTFSWWLLHEGWKIVWKRVEGAVDEVVGPLGLKTPLVYGELGALFAQIRRRIEQDADGKLFDFSPALHPPTQEFEIQTLIAGGSYTPPSASSAPSSFPPTHLSSTDPITPALRSLLNETSDALDSPDAALVRALSLDKLFSLAVEKLEVAFRSPTADGRGARFEDVTEKQARLASLLPVLTRLSAGKGDAFGAVLASGVNGNEFVEALEDVRELRDFAAVLYASWDRDNLRASCVL